MLVQIPGPVAEDGPIDIADVPRRGRVTIAGCVERVCPGARRGAPVLRCGISDHTAGVVVVLHGAGVRSGVHLAVTGAAKSLDGRLVVDARSYRVLRFPCAPS